MIDSREQIKILLVDDDNINNFLNSKLIKINQPDVVVDICISAQSALEKLTGDYSPSVILLDLNMPNINGWMFLDEFKKLEKKIPVIILTSSIDPHDHLKSKKYPEVGDFIEKPLNASKINRILNSILYEKTQKPSH